MESIRILNEGGDYSTLNYDYDETNSLFNLANSIFSRVLCLNPVTRKSVDWDNIFLALREFVSKKAEEGIYLCNIFPDTEDMDDDKFHNWIKYLAAAEGDDEPIIRRTCRDCGRDFYLFTSEIKFFNDKELSLPKRCKDCRAKRKQSYIKR